MTEKKLSWNANDFYFTLILGIIIGLIACAGLTAFFIGDYLENQSINCNQTQQITCNTNCNNEKCIIECNTNKNNKEELND